VLLIQSTIPWTVSEAGAYAAKIIRGARRGDLPIEQASRFTLVPNLKTARRLGINVNLVTLADKLTEPGRTIPLAAVLMPALAAASKRAHAV